MKTHLRNWRHSHGYLFAGTMRIARMDFDTDPDEAMKNETFDAICDAMNACAVISDCAIARFEPADFYSSKPNHYEMGHMEMKELGNWVRHSDYEKLQAEARSHWQRNQSETVIESL